ncbi:MAG: MFS transporter [Crenarchaeota archaeon]|nr:MFS transporter [Thermoproteota archaeon]
MSSGEARGWRARRGYRIGLLLSFFYNSAAGIIVNTIPLLILYLRGGPVALAAASTMLNLGFLIVSPLAGRLGDRIGRRPLILAGVALQAAAITASATCLELGSGVLIASSLVLGVASALLSPNLSMAMVEYGALRDKKPEEPLSRLGLAAAAGWLVGLLTASLVSGVSGTWFNIPASLAASTAAAVIAARYLPEPILRLERPVAARPSAVFLDIIERFRLVYGLLANPPLLFRLIRRRVRRAVTSRLLGVLLATSMGFMGVGVFFTQLPYYWKHVRGMTDPEILATSAVHRLSSIIGFLFMHRAAWLIGAKNLFIAAFAARTLVFLLPLATMNLQPVLQAVILYIFTGLTWSMISVSANSVVLEAVGVHRGGVGIGLLNTAISIGLIAGSAVSGIVAEYLGVYACFPIASMLAGLGAVTAYLAVKTGERRQDNREG